MKMKKKIIIGSILAVFILVSLPSISALSDTANSDNIVYDTTEQKEKMVSSIWDVFDIYIQMMYHQRLARVSMWELLVELTGMTGTISSLILFRVFLLATRTEVSKEVFSEVLNLLQDLFP